MQTADHDAIGHGRLQHMHLVIAKTKANINDNCFYCLFWGWVSFAIFNLYPDFGYQILEAATAIFTNYIIPGHLLRPNT